MEGGSTGNPRGLHDRAKSSPDGVLARLWSRGAREYLVAVSGWCRRETIEPRPGRLLITHGARLRIIVAHFVCGGELA